MKANKADLLPFSQLSSKNVPYNPDCSNSLPSLPKIVINGHQKHHLRFAFIKIKNMNFFSSVVSAIKTGKIHSPFHLPTAENVF